MRPLAMGVGALLVCLTVGCDTPTPHHHIPVLQEPADQPVAVHDPPVQVDPTPTTEPPPAPTFQPLPAPEAPQLYCGQERESVGPASDTGAWNKAAPLDPIPSAKSNAKGGTGRPPQSPRPLEGNVVPWSSGRRMATVGDTLFVVDRDNGRLVVLDRLSGELVRSIAVGSQPDQVVVGPDGTAFVSVTRCGEVVRVAPGGAKVDAWVAIGGGPTGLAMTEDGTHVLVSDTGGDRVLMLRASDLKVVDRLDGVASRPAGLAVTPQGTVVIAQRGPTALQVPLLRNRFGAPTGHALRSLSPTQKAMAAFIDTTVYAPANAVAATVHPGMRSTIVLHELARTGNISAAFGGTPVVTPGGYYPPPDPPTVDGHVRGEVTRPLTVALTSVNGMASANQSSTLPVMDPVTEETPLSLLTRPTDINHHPTLTLAFVTGMATDTVVAFNTNTPDAMSDPVAVIRVGRAPMAVTFSDDGMFAYVLNGHDFTVSEIPLMNLVEAIQSALPTTMMPAPLHLTHDRVTSFGEDPLPLRYHYGRRLFTTARNDAISRDGQLACVSCHIDGREDGVTWIIPEGPRQTPSLAGRLHDTAPFNWLGTKGTLIDNMTRTVARMGGTGLEPADLADLQQFMLYGLPAPRNERSVSPRAFTPAEQRGQVLFNDPGVGCAGCHAGEALTDGRTHDVGTARAGDVDPRLDTPSLRGLKFSAPYLHDGSADTLYDVLEATATTMGYTEHLTLEEKLDLIAYLETL